MRKLTQLIRSGLQRFRNYGEGWIDAVTRKLFASRMKSRRISATSVILCERTCSNSMSTSTISRSYWTGREKRIVWTSISSPTEIRKRCLSSRVRSETRSRVSKSLILGASTITLSSIVWKCEWLKTWLTVPSAYWSRMTLRHRGSSTSWRHFVIAPMRTWCTLSMKERRNRGVFGTNMATTSSLLSRTVGLTSRRRNKRSTFTCRWSYTLSLVTQGLLQTSHLTTLSTVRWSSSVQKSLATRAGCKCSKLDSFVNNKSRRSTFTSTCHL